MALIYPFVFTQFVHEPTHSSGNTLDLILSREREVFALDVFSVSSVVSAHFLIKFKATPDCPSNGWHQRFYYSPHWPSNFNGT